VAQQSNALSFSARSHDALIRVYDEAGKATPKRDNDESPIGFAEISAIIFLLGRSFFAQY
jgi:hypothetical protein